MAILTIIKDESGTTYGIVMFIIALATGVFAWMFMGLLMDSLEEFINSMPWMFSATIGSRVTDIVNIYSILPFTFLAAGVIFLIVRGLRRNSDVFSE